MTFSAWSCVSKFTICKLNRALREKLGKFINKIKIKNYFVCFYTNLLNFSATRPINNRDVMMTHPSVND